MKVAIFHESCGSEVIILEAKGNCQSLKDICGIWKYFDKPKGLMRTGRDLRCYNITFAHIGSDDGVILRHQRCSIDADSPVVNRDVPDGLSEQDLIEYERVWCSNR